jgi:beta-carotene hydroxylase
MSEDLTALNKQAISAAQNHMGHVAWLTVGFTFLVVLAFAINLMLFAQGLVSAWVSVLIVGLLTYFSYTPLHEAAHRNINGNNEKLTWLNDLCGYLVAPIIAIPYASHRLEHFTHHRYTNQPDKDPDFVINGLGKGLLIGFWTMIKFMWVQNAFFALNHWSRATIKERIVFCIEVSVSIGWRAAFILLVDQPGVAWVILVGSLIGGFFTAYWFAYRPHLPYKEPKRYKNTNSLIMPACMKPFEWIWLGQNLHSIHHLFPRVPFYRYHKLHDEIEPVLHAHGTPIIGIFSHKPIDK